MQEWLLFELNILVYFLFPFVIGRVYGQNRVGALYIYLGVVLFWGGFAGAIYSFKLSEAISISGGNIAYGAFMMTSVLLIITERSRSTFYKIIRLLIGIDVLVFVNFSLLLFVMKEGIAINPMSVPYVIFDVSYWVLIVGGVLIFMEILFLYTLFIIFGSRMKSVTALSFLYVAAYAAVLCMDGVLFPVLAFGLGEELIRIIIGNFPGKLVLAASFGLPLLAYLVANKDDVEDFLDTGLRLKDVVDYRFERLVEKIHAYEKREKQQRRKIDKLIDLSGQDQLTAIANRRKFENYFATEWSRAQREKKSITLAIGDIDHFKAYNDLYGHPHGDICLKKVACLWKEGARRPIDLAARIGGEEFALVYPNTTPETIIENLKTFQQRLRDARIEHAKSAVASSVTMSIGVASCVPQRGRSPIELFELADKRLYEAKRTGRNRIVCT